MDEYSKNSDQKFGWREPTEYEKSLGIDVQEDSLNLFLNKEQDKLEINKDESSLTNSAGVLTELKSVNTNIKGIHNLQQEFLKALEALNRGHRYFRPDESEILFKSQRKWTKHWIYLFCTMDRRLRTVVDGKTLQGIQGDVTEKGILELSGLAKIIPRPLPSGMLLTESFGMSVPRMLDPDDYYSRKDRIPSKILEGRLPVILEFVNQSDFYFKWPQIYLQTGSTFGMLADQINPGMREVACFYMGNHDSGVKGLCSYEISTTGSCLTIRMESFFNKKYWERYFGLAFTPTGVPIDDQMFTRSNLKVSSTDFEFSRDEKSPKIAVNGILAAMVSVWKDNDTTMVRVNIMKRVPTEPLPWMKLLIKPIKDGYTFPTSSCCNNIFGGRDGFVVLIENRLNVELKDFKWHIQSASEFTLLPQEIPPFTREMFYAFGEKSTKVIFSYRFERIDLRMACVVSTIADDNEFALGFLPAFAEVTEATIDSFTKYEEWKTRPYLHAKAKDGKQTLDHWNIRLTATMTTDAKSILKIAVSYF